MMKNSKIADIIDGVEHFRELRFLARVAGLTAKRNWRNCVTMKWRDGKSCVKNVQWDEALAVLRALLDGEADHAED